jgi:ABC-type molybdate transport system substrate-binding protein
MKTYRNYAVFVALLAVLMPLSVSADSLKLYAAGSLKAALGDVAASYEQTY